MNYRKLSLIPLLSLSLMQPIFASQTELSKEFQQFEQRCDREYLPNDEKEKCIELLFTLVDKDFAPAQLLLAELAMEEGSDELALHMFQRAADLGNSEAQYTLGKAYRDGKLGLIADSQKAFEWFKQAAEQGQAYAQHDLGARYLKGDGVAVNLPEAIKWFERSAQQENEYGLNKMALFYLIGYGVEQNERKAKDYYQRSCELGLQDSCDSLEMIKNSKK